MLRNIVGLDNGIKQKITELVSMLSRGNNPPFPIILIDGKTDTGKTFMANELAEELSHIKQNGEYVVDIEYIDCSIPNSIGKFDNLFCDRAYWNYKNRVFIMDNADNTNMAFIKSFFKSSTKSLNLNNIFFIITTNDDNIIDIFYDITYLNIHLEFPSTKHIKEYIYYLNEIANNRMDFDLDISVLGSCKRGFDKNIDPEFEMYSKLLFGLFGWSRIKNIIYKASIEAQNNSRDYITYRDICEGFMTSVGRPKGYMKDGEGKYILDQNLIRHVAYHEAGHAVISYMVTKRSEMNNGSIVEIPILAAIRADASGNSFVYRYSASHSVNHIIAEICVTLAGKATTEILNNYIDIGAESDIRKAYDSIKSLIMENGYGGINLIDLDHINDPGDEEKKAISATFTAMYESTLKMVKEYQYIIDAVAKEFINGRDLLTYYDLEEIIENTINEKR